MGLSVDTKSTFKYVLEDYRALPKEERPYLLFRYVSARDHARIERVFDEATDAAVSGDQNLMLSKAVEGINIALAGWSGYPYEYGSVVDGEKITLDYILTRADLIELRRDLSTALTLSVIEKKVSALQLQSTLAKSASEPETPKDA